MPPAPAPVSDSGRAAPHAEGSAPASPAAQPQQQQQQQQFQQAPPPEMPPRPRAMGVDEEVVHQLMQEVITGSADVQEVAAEQIRCDFWCRCVIRCPVVL